MLWSSEIVDLGRGYCHKSSDVMQAYERGTTLTQILIMVMMI
jgi:hypothetical protein